MSQFRNTTTHVVVNVDDSKDHRFGEGWVLVETELTSDEPEQPDGEPTAKWKVDQLKAHAESHGIDMGDAKTKPEILAALGVETS